MTKSHLKSAKIKGNSKGNSKSW